ncbi:hypothetical protein GCM10010371_52250 [Streptomyces subrutilus]|uniref:Uncharacterized protein n=1 Tax=Streptomyces subrutilus TaxID=36818 RepID=A0A918R6S9_9ACTN|nr:hypothetical protein GCM10010371_52250 [Streptomyces subrutilus]
MHAQVERGGPGEGPGELLAHEPEPVGAGQQGFPSVEDHRDGGECMVTGMCGEPRRGVRNDLGGDHFRPGSPALVCVFVDVAMITGKIASAVNFQDDLAKCDQAGHSASLERLLRGQRAELKVGA